MQQTTNHNLIWTFSQGTTQGNMYVWKPSYKISFWGHNAAYNSWSSARFHNTKYNPLTFKGLMLDISNAACTPQWPNVIYISNTVHALSFSALTVFAWTGNPNKLVVGSTTRPGIRQEQWCHLWRSGFRYYLCAHLTFGDQLREWKARHGRPLFWGWNVEPRWRRALVSLLAAFVEVWCILIFCSDGLAYTWQWRIG